MAVAIHAVLVAGGQFVPVAPDAPEDRAAYICDTAAVSLMLSDDVDRKRIPGIETLVIDCTQLAGTGADIRQIADSERLGTLTPENAAYTLFTSGSTGRPKA